jgi:hypothetical protein
MSQHVINSDDLIRKLILAVIACLIKDLFIDILKDALGLHGTVTLSLNPLTYSQKSRDFD